MKSVHIQRSLVEKVSAFLLALPHKQQDSSTQVRRVLAQLTKTTHDKN